MIISAIILLLLSNYSIAGSFKTNIQNINRLNITDMRKIDDNELIKIYPSLIKSRKDNEYIIIDIREPSEYKGEKIPNSINIPISKLDKTDVKSISNKQAIFYCRSGFRTRKFRDKILSMGFRESYYLEGGIEQWKKNGYKTVVNKSAPIDIIRQVHIIIGTMVLLGIILAYFISPYFIILSVIGGTGLLFAGISGYCLLGKALMYLPYNKI